MCRVPPVAQERVEQRPDGLVRVTLKKRRQVLGEEDDGAGGGSGADEFA